MDRKVVISLIAVIGLLMLGLLLGYKEPVTNYQSIAYRNDPLKTWYIPVAIKGKNWNGATDEAGTQFDKYVGGMTVYYNVIWARVENYPNIYDWDTIKQVDLAIKKAKRLGYPVFVTIKTKPNWAGNNVPCELPPPEYFTDYADFVLRVIYRYGLNENDVIGIWNEPDMPYSDETMYIYGCEGNTFAAGKRYAQFMNTVAKQISNKSKVYIVGGNLALSDNTFISGMASVGIDESVDAIGYHSYVSYPNTFFDRPITQANIVRKYFPSAPLYITETSYLSSDCSNPDYIKKKKQYMQYFYDQLDDWNIIGGLWYTIGGNKWGCSDADIDSSVLELFHVIIR